MQKKSLDRDAARRRVILDAARDCILKFGYAKSSLEDIAKQAAVSRPLIYRKFKSKEEIFGAVLEDLFETQYWETWIPKSRIFFESLLLNYPSP
jgi:AcrR family transcriptional regulator